LRSLETAHTIEVEREKPCVLPTAGVFTLPTMKYKLEERAIVAKLLFKLLGDLDED
jgi:hypothetical protein